jgi:uncharacterized membrane protein YphA (DoxX/SURF4 family)
MLTASGLLSYGIGHLNEASHISYGVPSIIAGVAGVFLLIGLWTPIVSTVIAVVEVWIVCSVKSDPWTPIVLATLGAIIAMVGPGAWSIDARLFGRKHIQIPER